MTGADIIKTAAACSGTLLAAGGLFAAWANAWPNRITARTAQKQQLDDEDRKLRDELRIERDHSRAERDAAIRDAALARAEVEHWRELAYSLREVMIQQQSTCRGKGLPCAQEFAVIHIMPYVRPQAAEVPKGA